MRITSNLPRRFLRLAVLLLVAAGFTSCSTGKVGLPNLSVVAFNFSPGFGGVHLNAPLEITFSAPVDAGTVNQDSIRIFTVTTTTENPDPGAPAVGVFVTNGNVVTFLPKVPAKPDLSDAGLRIGFTYTIQIPASPDVIDPVRTIEGDPNVVSFAEFFTTLNSTILPAPGDILAEPNLASLSLFFIDEFDETNSIGTDPCPRNTLPTGDRDSPQVVQTDPQEGESGFGTITGIQPGLGTAFVRLDPITLVFSEPVSPWRIRPQNISIKNTNLGGETFDLVPFFTQDRTDVRLLITVFDKDSAFDQASVPQGRYVLSLTQFTDLAGNPLVNSQDCVANGTFDLSFSTVSSPTLPTDLTLTFNDDDQDGHIDYGGLDTAVNDPNLLPSHMAPFLGGFATSQVFPASPSNQMSSANWGSTGLWTGCQVFYHNGYDPDDDTLMIPAALRLRGGAEGSATPIMAPIAGRANGPSDPSGSGDGLIPAASGEPGKVDFFLDASGVVTTAFLNTGNATTGPIVYHYNRFDLLHNAGGTRATLTYRKLNHDDSIFPMIIFVEDEAVITGRVSVDGTDGEFGFNGDNGGTNLGRIPGGQGGFGGPGGGRGGDGGLVTTGADVTLLNGQTGGVPSNVIGPLDDLSEAMAGTAGMATGGGGHWDGTQTKCDNNSIVAIPAYSGGGGAGQESSGSAGGDLDGITPGATDQGVGGQQFGSDTLGFADPDVLLTGGAGGGGGGADDDGGTDGSLIAVCPDGVAGIQDDGGGGGGGGAGCFALSCAGNIMLGEFDDAGTPGDPDDDVIFRAIIRAVGGRGGSTYAFVVNDPPEPAEWTDLNNDGEVTNDELTPSLNGQIGQGEAGGGGGGGNLCIVAGGDLTLVAVEMYVHGKAGGNAPGVEGSDRVIQDLGGNGGGGKIYLADQDGIDLVNEIQNNTDVLVAADPVETTDPDVNVMTGVIRVISSIWGDDPSEAMFGTTQIVSEFFDTLSDSTSYDGVRVLSNAPRFPYSSATPSMRTIRVFVDTTTAGAGGLPDLSPEDPTGSFTLNPLVGFSHEIGLHFDPVGNADPGGAAQFESFEIIQAGAQSQGKRFVRARIMFDLSLVGTPAQLIDSFAPAGAPNLQVAPGNTLGNQDTAPEGVPAVAELRVTFTP